MLLKNDAFHTQTKVDATRLEDAIVNDTKMAVANSDGTFELVTELANELAAECMKGGRKIIFVFEKILLKDIFKKEIKEIS